MFIMPRCAEDKFLRDKHVVVMKFGVKNGKSGSDFVLAALTCLLSIALQAIASTASAAPMPRIKPQAPEPVYLSQADYVTLDQFFEAVSRKKWSLAALHRKSLTDPVARSIADWSYFREDPPDLDYREAGVFLDAHTDWPSSNYIQQLAEKSIPEKVAPSAVLLFFENRQPATGTGKLRLAQALFAEGQPGAGAEYLQSAWVEHNWSSTREKQILRQYDAYLTSKDHAAKADRQLFEVQATNTKRLLPYLSGSTQRMAAARIALLRRDADAVALLNRLSKKERSDSGVLHAATRYYRRGNEELSAISYARQAPLGEQQLRNIERWWTEKRVLARWALKNGFYEDAYAMVAYTGLIDGEAFAQAEFEAGWIALRFLNDPERARPHFAYLNAGVTAPISTARAQYWLGRTFETAGDQTRADQHFLVAAEYPLTYYGQLAFEKVQDRATPPQFPASTEVSTDAETIFNARPLVYAMRVLAELDREKEFIFFARALDDQLQTPGEYAAYEQLMIDEGMIFLSVRAGKVAVKQNADAPSVSYPLVQVPEEARALAEHALILGLSRQESEFNPRAYSSARARGIMQLLPSTAKITARKEGLPYRLSRLLDDPSYNMIIGSAHLKHMLARFEGSYIMTLVAYNAGATRVDQWIDTYGDPRNPDVDPVDWVELIPFSETRNYVQRVLENTQIYRAQIERQPIPGQLARDLVRGGGTISAIGIQPPTPVLSRAAALNMAQTSPPKAEPIAFAATAQMTSADMLRPNKILNSVTSSDQLMLDQLEDTAVSTSAALPLMMAPAAPMIATPGATLPSTDQLMSEQLRDDKLAPLPPDTETLLPPIAEIQLPAVISEFAEPELIAGCDLGEDTTFLEADDLNSRQLAEFKDGEHDCWNR